MSSARPLSLCKLSGRIKLLLGVLVLLYLLVALVDIDMTLRALGYFLAISQEVVSILVLVFAIRFLSNLFLKPERIRKHLGRDSGFWGWVYAILGGIVISGPPYIIYPMLGELQKYRARHALIAAMLYNRNVKIHFLPAMVYYFGVRYTVVLSVYIIVFSVINGKVPELLVGKNNVRMEEA